MNDQQPLKLSPNNITIGMHEEMPTKEQDLLRNLYQLADHTPEQVSEVVQCIIEQFEDIDYMATWEDYPCTPLQYLEVARMIAEGYLAKKAAKE